MVKLLQREVGLEECVLKMVRHETTRQIGLVKQSPCQISLTEGRGKSVNFVDPRSAVMSVGQELAHERLKEVSHSPARSEGGLGMSMSGMQRESGGDSPGIRDIKEYWYVHKRSTGCP